MSILNSIRDMLANRSSVQMVADDPELTSELLLLVRMMFADGRLSSSELALFKSICETGFNIPSEDVPGVIEFLHDFGYETSGEQAASTFEHMPGERKRDLLVHLISMARADSRLHTSEAELIARVAAILGYSQEQVEQWL